MGHARRKLHFQATTVSSPDEILCGPTPHRGETTCPASAVYVLAGASGTARFCSLANHLSREQDRDQNPQHVTASIGDFKGTASLTGPAKNAYQDARATVTSATAPETLMLANLTNFAIMRSADNLARENIMQKATSTLDHDGVQSNATLLLEKVQKDLELSAALNSINKRESES